ncbi:MAG: DUF3817 domain-containing protein [Campylobacterales bacterium]|nr:DUF3817 domain-containing protein [Campylobacterales bacterium]
MKNKTILEKFRTINFIEGISYIVLLFIAMPLKYVFGIAVATKVMGSIHGFLFIVFMFLLASAHDEYKFKLGFTIKLFIASLIPFGTTWSDKFLTPTTVKEFQKI